jgi:hypothetical protein
MFIRILVIAVCAAAGFFAASAYRSPSDDAEPASPEKTPEPTVELKLPSAVESAFIAEWEQLHATHGDDMGAIYAAIQGSKESFRKQAFRSALIGEWSERDPRAALAYILEKDPGSAGQIAREWMRRDPNAAINALLAPGDKAKDRLSKLRDLLSEIAKTAPSRLVEVLTALKAPDGRWDEKAMDAFAIFAAKDPAAARAAAESVTGELRGQALGGVAKAWAEKDGDAAIAWVQAMPAGEARDEAMKAALVGWAKTDPFAALGKLDLAPPGGGEMMHASDAGVQVLRVAAKKDWDGTLAWLRDNPGKVGYSSLDGLQNELTRRLGVDTTGTMRTLVSSGVPNLERIFGNAMLNEAYEQHDAIWHWLEGQPSSDLTRNLRESVVNAIGWKEPDAAFGFLDKLPDTPENAGLIESGIGRLFRDHERDGRFETWLDQASPRIRPLLIQAAFMYGEDTVGNNPALWIGRLNEVPPKVGKEAIAHLASSWAASDPQAAAQWVSAISDTAARDSALIQIAIQWSGDDPREAALWVDSLPPGTGRDNAALGLVSTLRESQPENAWTWAVSVESPELREISLARAYKALQGKDPTVAEQLLTSSALPEAEIKTLRDWFKAGAKPK